MTEPTLPGELTTINRRLDAGDKRMARIESELKSNTELTQEIRDLIDAAKVGFKVLGGMGVAVKWLGSVAAAAVAIYAFFYAITHGGATPK